MSKDKRKYDKIAQRVSKLETRVNRIENNQSKMQNQIDRTQEMQIVQLIEEEFPPDSGRPKYRYEDIGDLFGKSPSTISRIAEKHGVSRRKNF